ncbi:MAG: SMP-30/gluconolactonase/LRE family protein [Planctomycetia bacterium]
MAARAWWMGAGLALLGLASLVRAEPPAAGPAVVEPSLVEEGHEVITLASGMGFTEGPVWDPVHRRVIFSDIPAGRLMQWDSKDGLRVLREAAQPNGNAFDREGRLLTCQHGARNLVRTRAGGMQATGEVEELAGRHEGRRLNSPNDLALADDGSIWFTDPPWGLKEPHELPGHFVFRWRPPAPARAGQPAQPARLEAVITDLAMPNGIAFAPDGTRLWVADTGGLERHPDPALRRTPPAIHAYRVGGDGALGERLLSIPARSDGMKVDVQGHLYTTDRAVVVWRPDGTLRERIAVPEPPANLCFGDADGQTLFITARTSLYAVRLRVAGARLLPAPAAPADSPSTAPITPR